LTGDRHGHLRDAVAKALGGTFGIGAALLILAVVAYYRPLLPTPHTANPTTRRGQRIRVRASAVQHEDVDPRS
jgi:hypothetical protein